MQTYWKKIKTGMKFLTGNLSITGQRTGDPSIKNCTKEKSHPQE
jgi:hypothetical protein